VLRVRISRAILVPLCLHGVHKENVTFLPFTVYIPAEFFRGVITQKTEEFSSTAAEAYDLA
jgi:hypothetical protein